MLAHFTISGIAPDIHKSNPYALARWRHAVEIHDKIINPMIYDCSVYHHTPFQNYKEWGDWVVLEYVSKDKSTAIASFFRLQGESRVVFPFVSKGLSAGKRYEVTFDNTGETAVIDGVSLISSGLNVRVPGKMMSELLILKECK